MNKLSARNAEIALSKFRDLDQQVSDIHKSVRKQNALIENLLERMEHLEYGMAHMRAKLQGTGASNGDND